MAREKGEGRGIRRIYLSSFLFSTPRGSGKKAEGCLGKLVQAAHRGKKSLDFFLSFFPRGKGSRRLHSKLVRRREEGENILLSAACSTSLLPTNASSKVSDILRPRRPPPFFRIKSFFFSFLGFPPLPSPPPTTTKQFANPASNVSLRSAPEVGAKSSQEELPDPTFFGLCYQRPSAATNTLINQFSNFPLLSSPLLRPPPGVGCECQHLLSSSL